MQGKWAVVTFVWVLVLAGVGSAGTEAVDARMCPAPISVCHPFDTADTLVTPAPGCPPGSICTCVPSCPTCLDCPVQVCIPDEGSKCRTACDCPTGLGCFNGRCIAGFAPVYCCEADVCPAGQMCQHQDGTWERLDRCPRQCDDSIWRCGEDGLSSDVCGEGRSCTCTTTCPFCEPGSAPEICGPPVCVPEGTHPPLLCDSEADCPVGRRCACVSSCPTCDDCDISVCVPDCNGPTCQERIRTVTRRIAQVVERTNACRVHSDCARVDTSTECLGTCGEWVNRHYEGRVLRFVHRLDRRVCSTFNEDGCPTATPACLFQRGLCIDGECRGVPILPRPLRPETDAELLEIPLQDLEDRLP